MSKVSLSSEMKSFLDACLSNLSNYTNREKLEANIVNYKHMNVDWIYWHQTNGGSYKCNQMQKAFTDIEFFCQEYSNGNFTSILEKNSWYEILSILEKALFLLFENFDISTAVLFGSTSETTTQPTACGSSDGMQENSEATATKKTRKTTKTAKRRSKKMTIETTENNSIETVESQENKGIQAIETSEVTTQTTQTTQATNATIETTENNTLDSLETQENQGIATKEETQENAVLSDETQEETQATIENNTIETLDSLEILENKALTAEEKQAELRKKESKNFSISTIEKLQIVMHSLENEIQAIRENNRISQIEEDVTDYDISTLRWYVKTIYQFLQDNVNFSHYHLKKGYIKFKDYKESEAIEAIEAWKTFKQAITVSEQKKEILKVLNNLNNFSLMTYYEYGIKRIEFEIEKKRKEQERSWYATQKEWYEKEIQDLERQLQELKNSQIKALASNEMQEATELTTQASDQLETTENNTLETLENKANATNEETQEKAVLSDEEILVKCQLSFDFDTVESEESEEEKTQETTVLSDDEKQEVTTEINTVETSQSLENQGNQDNLTDDIPTLILEESEEEKQETQATNATTENNTIETLETQENQALQENQEEKQQETTQETAENNTLEMLETQENQALQEITFKELFLYYDKYFKKETINHYFESKHFKVFLIKILEIAIDEKNASCELSIENYINGNPGNAIAKATKSQLTVIKARFAMLQRLCNITVDSYTEKIKEKIESFMVTKDDPVFAYYFTLENNYYYPNWHKIYETVSSFFDLFTELFTYPKEEENNQTTENNSLDSLETQENQASQEIEKPQNRFYGYAMVNTHTQSLEMQERHILNYCTQAKIYKDTLARKKDDSKEFSKLFKHLKNGGGIVIIDSIRNLAKTAPLAFEKYKLLFDNKIELIFLQESHLNTAFYYDLLSKQETTEINTVKTALLATIENAINACFLTLYKRKKAHATATANGISKAKASGAKIGNQKGESRHPKEKAKNLRRIKSLSQFFNGNLSDYELSKKLGITRQTVIKYRNELKNMQENA